MWLDGPESRMRAALSACGSLAASALATRQASPMSHFSVRLFWRKGIEI